MTNAIQPAIGLAPNDTVEFFRAKGYLPADYHEDWSEIWQEEHGRWFTVTKLFNNQVLEDVRRSLDRVLAEGGTFAEWKKDVLPRLQGKDGVDPRLLTSEARLRVVYDTNLRMARAAGQWKRIQEGKRVLPFLMYSAVNDGRTRPLHRQWGGLDGGQAVVLPVDHPWWDTHYPPCGWNCRCGVVPLSARALERRGLKVTADPPEGPSSVYRRATGELVQVPAGVDPGFAYNPGKAHLRGLAPVPETGFIDQPRIVPDAAPRPAMPPPRQAAASDLLDEGVDPQEFARRFLAEFGAKIDEPQIFYDELGEPVAIDAAMVRDGRGFMKAGKLGRGRYALLAARAMREPDEIWHEWVTPDPAKEAATGKVFPARLRRRYVARFVIDGEERVMFAALDLGARGWEGRTWFSPERGVDYLDQSVRGGVLAWRRDTGTEKGSGL